MQVGSSRTVADIVKKRMHCRLHWVLPLCHGFSSKWSTPANSTRVCMHLSFSLPQNAGHSSCTCLAWSVLFLDMLPYWKKKKRWSCGCTCSSALSTFMMYCGGSLLIDTSIISFLAWGRLLTDNPRGVALLLSPFAQPFPSLHHPYTYECISELYKYL